MGLLNSRKIREKVKRDYDTVAFEFSQTRKNTWTEFEQFRAFLRPGLRVLDLGCGNGRLKTFLKEFSPSFYKGVDQSGRLLDEALAAERANRSTFPVEFQVADMMDLEAYREDERFDLIFMIASFHHLPPSDQVAFLGRVRGLLKPGGRLILTNWNLWSLRFWKAWLKNLFLWPWYGFRGLLIPWQGRVSRFYFAFHQNELRGLFFRAGFKVLHESVGRNFVHVLELDTMPFVDFGGVRVDAARLDSVVAALEDPQIIFTPNPEILLEAWRNPSFKAVLSKGTLMLPDGHGLQLVSTLKKIPIGLWGRRLILFFALPLFFLRPKWFCGLIPELVHGSDFMDLLIAQAARRSWPVFFLGGEKGVAQKAADFFESRYVDLQIAGFSDEDPGDAAVEVVRASGAQVVLVAYGAPKQEQWIVEASTLLPEVRLWMGVGGSFDFYSGKVARAPRFLRRLGLEWFWRLLLNPRARLKRIWNAVVVFPWKGV